MNGRAFKVGNYRNEYFAKYLNTRNFTNAFQRLQWTQIEREGEKGRYNDSPSIVNYFH